MCSCRLTGPWEWGVPWRREGGLPGVCGVINIPHLECSMHTSTVSMVMTATALWACSIMTNHMTGHTVALIPSANTTLATVCCDDVLS